MGSLFQLAWCFLSTQSPLASACWAFSLGRSTLIRMSSMPKPKVVDRWTEKRAMFSVYDNIGILGDFKVHPKDIIIGPSWLRGWCGNELLRCIRKQSMVGPRMSTDDLHNLKKHIRYLYKCFNHYGKHR